MFLQVGLLKSESVPDPVQHGFGPQVSAAMRIISSSVMVLTLAGISMTSP
jgi:hypothetical protein